MKEDDRELTSLLFFVAMCWYSGWAAIFAAVVVIRCVDDDCDDDGGDVAAADNSNEGFTVFGIPQMCASVVLTTFRLGLPGSHIFALRSGDKLLLTEVLLLPPTTPVDDDVCCAFTRSLLDIAKTRIPTRNRNTAQINLIRFTIKSIIIVYTYKVKAGL